MGDEISGRGFDLFGLPLAAERGRGRPAHVWSKENSDKACLLFASGYGVMEVARALGLSKPTFYKHYSDEIARAKLAPIMMKATQLERLNRAAASGNVAAEKALAGMIQAEQIKHQAKAVVVNRREEAAVKPEVKGKKEAAKDAAANAAGRFGRREPPALLLN